MEPTPGYLEHALRLADRLRARILSRDGLNLGPPWLTRATAHRFRAGLHALEAFLRRVLLLLALHLEPGLRPRTAMWKPARQRRDLDPAKAPIAPGLRLFPGEYAGPQDWDFSCADRPARSPGPYPSAPLFARLAMLGDLLTNPHGRARRLAFHLARRRPGLLLAPNPLMATSLRRFGTEISMQFDAMAVAMITAARARPPPLGPLPRAGPRIRRL